MRDRTPAGLVALVALGVVAALIGVVAVAGVPGATDVAPVAGPDVSVERLEVGASAAPLGIDDPRPDFTWTLRSERRGVRQEAFRILVASSAELAARGVGDLWDSGEVRSAATGVEYAGAALRSRTRYFWTVRSSAPGATRWARPAWFETAYLDSREWRGEWISGEPRPVRVPSVAEGLADDACCVTPRTKLAKAAPAGATAVLVESASALAAGTRIAVGGQRVTVSSVAALGSGARVRVTPALRARLAAGTAVRGSGTPGDVCRAPGVSPNAGRCAPVRPNMLLRKGFDVAPESEHGRVLGARLHAAGAGFAEATVNGVRPAPGQRLNPGFTDYADTVQYTTDDVTALLRQDRRAPDRNVVAVELAAGRYDSESRPSYHAFEAAQWRAQEALRADLWIRYADGTEQLVPSDSSWRAGTGGPTRYADFDSGETYDARRALPGWDRRGYDASGWPAARPVDGPAGELVAQQHEPTAEVASHPGPFRRWSPSPGVVAFDTGRQRTGWATLRVWGARPGQVIRVRHVERRDDDPGRDDPDVPGTGQDGPLRPPGGLQQEVYVSDGTGTAERPEVFAPRWSFAGFQWVLVDGGGHAPLPRGVQVDVASVRELRTGFAETGSFASSSPLLNRIWANVRGSIAANWVAGFSMDTPTYEKDGWTGDAQVILPTAANLFDLRRSLRKAARDAVDSQLADGQVGLLIPGIEGHGYCSPRGRGDYTPCGTSPSVDAFKPPGAGSTPIWDAYLVVLPTEAWWRYKDPAPLRTAYGAMTAYLDRWLQGGRPYARGPGGWFTRDGTDDWTLDSGLGDWAFVTGAEGNAAEGTDLAVGDQRAATSTAYVAYLATRTAEAADVLLATTGDPRFAADARTYRRLFADVRADFRARWWDPRRGWFGQERGAELRQGLQAMALAFGLVADRDRRALQEKLARDVAVIRSGHAMTGFAGLRWLWPALSDAAHEGVPLAREALFAVALQTTYPSYGHQIGLGFTGLGEYWESDTRTRNHQFQGSIGQWFVEELAGIKPATPGYDEILVRPLPGADLGVSHAAATVRTPHGVAASSWRQAEDGTFVLDVTVPANATASVHVPAAPGAEILESGVPACGAPGVRPGGRDGDAEVLAVGSGRYVFTVSPAR